MQPLSTSRTPIQVSSMSVHLLLLHFQRLNLLAYLNEDHYLPRHLHSKPHCRRPRHHSTAKSRSPARPTRPPPTRSPLPRQRSAPLHPKARRTPSPQRRRSPRQDRTRHHRGRDERGHIKIRSRSRDVTLLPFDLDNLAKVHQVWLCIIPWCPRTRSRPTFPQSPHRDDQNHPLDHRGPRIGWHKDPRGAPLKTLTRRALHPSGLQILQNQLAGSLTRMPTRTRSASNVQMSYCLITNGTSKQLWPPPKTAPTKSSSTPCVINCLNLTLRPPNPKSISKLIKRWWKTSQNASRAGRLEVPLAKRTKGY